MPNPYEWIFGNPELLFWYIAATLTLIAWIYWSAHKTLRLATAINDGRSRWRGQEFPDYRTTKDVCVLVVIVAANLFLMGGYVHLAI